MPWYIFCRSLAMRLLVCSFILLFVFFGFSQDLYSIDRNINGVNRSFDFNYIVDSEQIFVSMLPDIVPVGPIFGKTDQSTQEYVRRIFGFIIKAASQAAKTHYYTHGEDNNYSYYTFLLTALATTQHESGLIHVKQIQDPERCHARSRSFIEQLNTFLSLPTGATHNRYVPVFTQDCIKDAYKLLLPPVSRKGLRNDVGIMQLNLPSWRNYLDDPSFLFDVVSNINLGVVSILFKGFQKIRDRLKYYNGMCGKNLGALYYNPFQGRKIDERVYSRNSIFYNLSVASWSTNYNQGPMSLKREEKFCRFLNEKSQKDKGYKRSLDSLVLYENSLFHQYLPEESLEREVLEEIVYNFRSIFSHGIEKERNQSTNEFIDRIEISNNKNFKLSERFNYQPNYVLARGNISVYSAEQDNRFCGSIKNTAFNLGLNVIERGDEWSLVEIPLYTDFLEPPSEKIVIIKKSANIRTKPINSSDTLIELHKPDSNSRFLLLGEAENSYYPILYGEITAYVHKNLVTIEEEVVMEIVPKCQLSKENNKFFIKSSSISYEFSSDAIGEAYLKTDKTIVFRVGPGVEHSEIQRKRITEKTSILIFKERRIEGKYRFWYEISNPFTDSSENRTWVWSGSLNSIQLNNNMKD